MAEFGVQPLGEEDEGGEGEDAAEDPDVLGRESEGVAKGVSIEAEVVGVEQRDGASGEEEAGEEVAVKS